MSARSRYLEAISPRNENRDDDVISPTATTSNHPSASNVSNVNVPSWQQNQQPNNSNMNNSNAASIGLKRTTSVKSPSSITQQRTTGRTNNNNNNSGAVHAFLNHNSNGNSGGNIVGNNAPPPPPPPGMPVKRKKNSSKTNLTVTTDDDKQLATKSKSNAKSSKSNSTTSPVRAAGEQWSPREEIQSGNVQKYKNMIWGGNGDGAAPPSSTPDSPVASAVKTFEANSPNRAAAVAGGAIAGRGGSGKSPPRNSVAPSSSSSSMSPSRPTPFYKRTAPPPIVTTPNRPTSTSKTAAITSTMPTPPSRVGVRQKRGVSPSPALPMSGGNVGGGGVNNNNKPATPLQQRRGNLNIAPLVTSFEGEMKQKESDVVVRTILHHQKQPQPHLPPSSSNNAPPSLSSPPQSSQQQQQGITTITAFKRPNHKVGIIFTRQSSSSPDVAIIARILPESIFAQHDEAERRDQALRVAALKKQGLTMTTMSPLAVKAATRGLEGSEVIAVNGVPVRNPRHAAEMVAKAVEEVRLTICKMVVDNNSGGVYLSKVSGWLAPHSSDRKEGLSCWQDLLYDNQLNTWVDSSSDRNDDNKVHSDLHLYSGVIYVTFSFTVVHPARYVSTSYA